MNKSKGQNIEKEGTQNTGNQPSGKPSGRDLPIWRSEDGPTSSLEECDDCPLFNTPR